MITLEERQEIIDAAVEKALLSLPAVMGNLMAQQVVYNKLNSQFYKDHPDFAAHKDVVASTVEKVDGQNPLLSYEEKLAKAVPEIRQRLQNMKSMDMEKVSTNPKRVFEGEFGSLESVRPGNNGEI